MTRFSFLLLSLLVAEAGLGVEPRAQAPATGTAYVVAYVDILPSARNTMATAFRRYRDASRAETGFQGFELLEQVGRPSHFVVLESWADQAAFDAHAMAAHVKQYRDALDAIRLSGYDQRPYKALAVAPPGAANNQAIRIVTHVDILGQQPGIPGLLVRYAETSRQERGALRIDILQHAMRANHFTVVETWANQAALDAHAAAAHTKQYRDALTPITGSPMDERVLRSGESENASAIVRPPVDHLVKLGAAPVTNALRSNSTRPVLYAAVGPDLIRFDVDVENGSLSRRDVISLPANVQEAALHPSGRYLYVAWSNGGASNAGTGGVAPRGTSHGVTAFRIDQASGALQVHGSPASLPSRPIHITTDVTGTHILTAFNDPSGVTSHALQTDGTIGREVKPSGPLDVGIYGHQVRVAPSNRTVILVTRGNGPTATRPEDPGALKIFDYADGVLSNHASIAPAGGFGFQSRHLDFHPSRPWFFLTLERQNKLQVYRLTADGVDPRALFTKDTLADPRTVRPGQTTSTIHVHPNGRFVYLGNRASATTDVNGSAVWAGGENSIAVFAIDQTTGEPRLIQHADTRGVQPRTFSIDAAGRVLVVGNQTSISMRDGEHVKTVPASISVFRIRDDGTLAFTHTYPIDVTPSRSLFWLGLVPTSSPRVSTPASR